MTLGERCDEIVRLIDETLSAVAGEVDGLDGAAFGSRVIEPGFPDDELDRFLAFEPLHDVGMGASVGVAG